MDDQLVLGLEARVGRGNRWLGFGFSAANATDVTMPGADVAVGACAAAPLRRSSRGRGHSLCCPPFAAPPRLCFCRRAVAATPSGTSPLPPPAPTGGIVGGECFGQDYFLQARAQCSYVERSGVCPDAALSGDPRDNQVQLLACEQAGEVLAVTLARPLGASDALDRAWPLDGSGFPVWAAGPVSEGSNASAPVVLYHRLQVRGYAYAAALRCRRLACHCRCRPSGTAGAESAPPARLTAQLPGTADEESVHAPVGQGYRLNLGAPSPPSTCAPLLETARGAPAPAAQGPDAAPALAPAPAPRQPPAVLRGATELNVTEGPNPNYPNPPGKRSPCPRSAACAACAAPPTALPPPPPAPPTRLGRVIPHQQPRVAGAGGCARSAGHLQGCERGVASGHADAASPAKEHPTLVG